MATEEEPKAQPIPITDHYTFGLRLPDGRLVTLQQFLDENPNLRLVSRENDSLDPITKL